MRLPCDTTLDPTTNSVAALLPTHASGAAAQPSRVVFSPPHDHEEEGGGGGGKAVLDGCGAKLEEAETGECNKSGDDNDDSDGSAKEKEWALGKSSVGARGGKAVVLFSRWSSPEGGKEKLRGWATRSEKEEEEEDDSDITQVEERTANGDEGEDRGIMGIDQRGRWEAIRSSFSSAPSPPRTGDMDGDAGEAWEIVVPFPVHDAASSSSSLSVLVCHAGGGERAMAEEFPAEPASPMAGEGAPLPLPP